MAVEVGSLNPFASVDIGVGTIGTALIIFFGVIVFILSVAGFVFWRMNKKKYKHIIPLYKKIGSATIKVATYKAKDYPIGKAGDKLWLVKLSDSMFGGAKKYIPPATLQTAPFEYTHFERSDGEWINISMPDVDEIMQQHKVKYVHQDMRANRVAINTLLDQRFTDKTFWDKYGDAIVHIIMYLVITVAMVVIFYQWSDITTQVGTILDRAIAYEEANKPVNIVPVAAELIFLMFRGRKK